MNNLYRGDCLEVMRTLPDGCVDAIVTDPPYGLSFMGKKWDYDVPGVEVWTECLRVLKPGGHMLAFAGTRTQHRMAVRIEDSGFEIRDLIAWVYGSGFPKSLDVSKALDKAAGVEREVIGTRSCRGRTSQPNTEGIDPGALIDITAPATDAARQWQGWGTALKPALEPITVARKPLVGTVAANVLAHGTGALNIDACRIAPQGEGDYAYAPGAEYEGRERQSGFKLSAGRLSDIGRWPANLIHDGSDEVLQAFPQAPGQLAPESFTAPSSKTRNTFGERGRRKGGFGNVGAEKGDPVPNGPMYSDKGSAARFFYCAKASRRDRNDGVEHLTSGTHSPGTFQAEGTDRSSPNNHPTVKPTDLMRYLCRLITPPGGVVLDPFMGSGSTGKAAMLEGFGFIGIERDEGYFQIAKSRIEAAMPIPEWLKC